MFISHFIKQAQDHGHRKKTQAILALNSDPSSSPNLQRTASCSPTCSRSPTQISPTGHDQRTPHKHPIKHA